MKNVVSFTLSQNERLASISILFFLSAFGFLDFYFDIRNSAPTGHLIMESILSSIGIFWSAKLVLELRNTKKSLASLARDLDQQTKVADQWRKESAKFIEGLHGLILAQFDKWQLSVAETDVALLLLKGFSLKEIAHLREVSERTVSQQTVSIYAKSGLKGRIELTAFFFEDLLAPSRPV